jgi:hypothetical protein
MTAKLSTGPNQIKIFATSKEALRPDISSSTILAVPGAGAIGSSQITNNNNHIDNAQTAATADTAQ